MILVGMRLMLAGFWLQVGWGHQTKEDGVVLLFAGIMLWVPFQALGTGHQTCTVPLTGPSRQT